MIDRISRGLCSTALLVPLVLVPGFFFPYVTTRAVLFRACVAVGLFLVLLKAQLRRSSWESTWDWTFVALLAFIFALTLSAAFGVSPWRSFYGDYERMGGVWAWLHLGGFYLLLRASLKTDRQWRRFFGVLIAIGTTVSLLGLAERYQDSLGVSWWIGQPGTAIITTVGNGGIAAAYLIFVVGLALFLSLGASSIRYRFMYVAAAAIGFIAILLTRNRSSLIGIMAGTIVAAAYYLLATRQGRPAGEAQPRGSPAWRRAAIWLLVASAMGAAALVTTSRVASGSRFVERLPPTIQRVVRTAPRGGDASRLIQWKASWDGFRARPLLGYGPENYHVVWGEQLGADIYRYDPDSRWDRAHNAFLEVLATSGLVGGLALLWVIIALCHSLTRAHRQGALSHEACALFAGLFSAYGVYLAFWFFDLNSVMVFIAVTAYVASRVSGGPILHGEERVPLSTRSKVLLGFASAALVGTLYVHGYETLRVAAIIPRINFAAGTERSTLRDFRAVFSSPAPISYHTLLIYSQYLRALSPQFDAIRADPRRHAELDEAFTQSFGVVEREARRDPRNERIALHKARIAMLAAQYYGEPRFFAAALETMRRAVSVSPRRIQTRHVLANAYLVAGQPVAAFAQLDTALRIYPSYAPTHLHLGLAYEATGDPATAGKWLTSALDLGGRNLPPRVFLDVAAELARNGDRAAGAQLLRRYLAVKYGPAWLWPPTLLRQVPPEDLRVFALLVSIQPQRGTGPAAEASISAIRRMCPLRVPQQRQTFDICGAAASLIAPDFRSGRFQGGGILVGERAAVGLPGET